MAIQIRRGTDSQWESNKSNIVEGEPAITTDTGRLFVGTGSGTYEEYVNKAILADYVVEQGTSGIWTYRKWESGIAECWTTSYIVLAISAGSAVSSTVEVTFPFTFAATPTFTTGLCQNASSTLNAGIVDQVSISTTKLGLKSFRNSANADAWAVEPRVYVYVRGRWK